MTLPTKMPPSMPNVDPMSESPVVPQRVVWQPWIGVLFVLVIYFVSQIGSVFIVSIYPALMHWSSAQSLAWQQNNVSPQFFFVLLAEAISVGGIWLFLRHYKQGFSAIGLKRPHGKDFLYALATLPVYFIVYAVMVTIATASIHSFNANQQQQIGFNNVHGGLQLILTAISLIVLPPIAEEIMVRGLLYSSFKKWMPRLVAVLLTSLLFASAHLDEGGAAGPLWIGFLDTFILSLFLIYLKEKTQNLWASISLHALKNGIAYIALFIAPLIHLH